MTARFGGFRALVTGASRGIGAGIAERLAAEGAAVAIAARTVDEHDHLPGSLRETRQRLEPYGTAVAVLPVDLTDEQARQHLVARAAEALGGPIQILVNNAAAAIYDTVAAFPLRRRRVLFEMNVHVPVDLAQAAIGDMRAAGAGWIVNLTSAAERPWPGPPFVLGSLATTIGVYGASKAALSRITNALGAELYGTGIRVNAVEPRGAVLSEGAIELVGATVRPDRVEPLEHMVEAVIALCECPADVTANTFVSGDVIDQWGLTVHGLNGAPI